MGVKFYDPNFHEFVESQYLVFFSFSWTRGLVELKFYDPNFHESVESQYLVVFPLCGVMELKFYDPNFHESMESQHLVVSPSSTDTWHDTWGGTWHTYRLTCGIHIPCGPLFNFAKTA